MDIVLNIMLHLFTPILVVLAVLGLIKYKFKDVINERSGAEK